MSTAVQRRRGTNTEHDSFTGLEGEISVNTTNESVHVHDGSTAGGFEMARADGSNWAITNNISTTGNISFGDNDKAIFGAGSDLQIYHDGSNSIIEDTSTGNLQLITNGNAIALKTSDGDAMLSAIKDGDVKLYYNNNLKLATTSTGIDVTGTATMDGLTVDGTNAGLAISGPSSQLMKIATTSSLDQLAIATAADVEAVRIDASQNVIVGGTTAGAAGAVTLYADGTFKSNGIDDNATTEIVQIGDTFVQIGPADTSVFTFANRGNSGAIAYSGGNSSSAGFNITQYGGAHASVANDMRMRAGATTVLYYDDSADRFYVPVDDFVVGGTTAGAASAVTLYATGAGRFSTGSSGASAYSSGDDLVVEGSGNAGISILSPDADASSLIFGSDANNLDAFIQYDGGSNHLLLNTANVGDDIVFRADNSVTNLTLSGASGSELLTAAGSVSVTDFLRIPSKGELTIAAGVITVTGSRHTVDTQGDAASDDLDTINGGTDGDILILRSANNARTVTVKDSTGNIQLAGDFSLSSTGDAIVLYFSGSAWIELTRSNNA
jgi:hypothetical protein